MTDEKHTENTEIGQNPKPQIVKSEIELQEEKVALLEHQAFTSKHPMEVRKSARENLGKEKKALKALIAKKKAQKVVSKKNIKYNKHRKAIAQKVSAAKKEIIAKVASDQAEISHHLTNIPNPLNNTENNSEVARLCREHKHDPIKQLILTAKKKDTEPALKLAINKYLTNKLTPDLKSLDLNVEKNLNVRVTVVSFKDANKPLLEKMDRAIIETNKSLDYSEFEEMAMSDVESAELQSMEAQGE